MKIRSLSLLAGIILLFQCNVNAQSIIISAAPASSFSGIDTICAGEPVIFTAVVSGVASYTLSWKLNGVSITGASSSTYTTSSLVTGNVISCWLYTVTGDTLLALSDTIHMIVNPSPHVSMITGNGNVCIGDTIHLYDSIAGGVWSSTNTAEATIDASGVVTAIAPVFGPALRMVYKITNSCGTDSARFRVRINLPAGPVTGPASICMDSLSFFRDTATGGMWTSSDTDIANFVFPMGIVQGNMPGTVTITYRLTNACGAYVDSILLTVVNCDSASGVAQTISAANSFNIYPNPNTGMFSIVVSSGIYSRFNCSVVNILGEKVKDFTMAANKESMVEIGVPPGVYFITATAGDEKYTSKLVISQ